TLAIVIRFRDRPGDVPFSLVHRLDGLPVVEGRLVGGVEREGLIQTCQSGSLVAEPRLSQGQVPIRLDMPGILLQNSLKQSSGLFIILLAEVLERRIKQFRVLEVRIKGWEQRGVA